MDPYDDRTNETPPEGGVRRRVLAAYLLLVEGAAGAAGTACG